jgi:hypothetical protein
MISTDQHTALPSTDTAAILLLDGAPWHITALNDADLTQELATHNISIVKLPAKCSGAIQPCDVGKGFIALKTMLRAQTFEDYIDKSVSG